MTLDERKKNGQPEATARTATQAQPQSEEPQKQPQQEDNPAQHQAQEPTAKPAQPDKQAKRGDAAKPAVKTFGPQVP